MSHQLKYNRLKRRKRRNIVLNIVCILIAGSGLAWTANYFWRYINYEITNDAFVDQYIAPINIRVGGYIQEVRFRLIGVLRQNECFLDLPGCFSGLPDIYDTDDHKHNCQSENYRYDRESIVLYKISKGGTFRRCGKIGKRSVDGRIRNSIDHLIQNMQKVHIIPAHGEGYEDAARQSHAHQAIIMVGLDDVIHSVCTEDGAAGRSLANHINTFLFRSSINDGPGRIIVLDI